MSIKKIAPGSYQLTAKGVLVLNIKRSNKLSSDNWFIQDLHGNNIGKPVLSFFAAKAEAFSKLHEYSLKLH